MMKKQDIKILLFIAALIASFFLGSYSSKEKYHSQGFNRGLQWGFDLGVYYQQGDSALAKFYNPWVIDSFKKQDPAYQAEKKREAAEK